MVSNFDIDGFSSIVNCTPKISEIGCIFFFSIFHTFLHSYILEGMYVKLGKKLIQVKTSSANLEQFFIFFQFTYCSA